MSDPTLADAPEIDRTVFEVVVETFRPHAGEICLLYHTDLVRLHGIATDDEDIYYVVEEIRGRNLYWASAVGAITPLRALLPEEIYARAEEAFCMAGVPAREFETIIEEKSVPAKTNMSDEEISTMLDHLAIQLDPGRPVEARRVLSGIRNAETEAQSNMTRGMIALLGGLSMNSVNLTPAITQLVEEGHLKAEGLTEIETWSLQRPEEQPEFA